MLNISFSGDSNRVDIEISQFFQGFLKEARSDHFLDQMLLPWQYCGIGWCILMCLCNAFLFGCWNFLIVWSVLLLTGYTSHLFQLPFCNNCWWSQHMLEGRKAFIFIRAFISWIFSYLIKGVCFMGFTLDFKTDDAARGINDFLWYWSIPLFNVFFRAI